MSNTPSTTFVVWYNNGQVVRGSTFQEWLELPIDGVLYLLLLFPDGTSHHCAGTDLYWSYDFGQGQIYAHDNDRDGVLRRLPWVKFGQWTSPEQFQQISEQAIKTVNVWHKTYYQKPLTSDCQGCG